MPKQTHLSKEFFVNASEIEARQHILQLPNCIHNIKFVAEDSVKRSMKFVYERPAESPEYYNYIDVSILPLSVHQTRVRLHGSYINGNVFNKDFKIINALSNFESAVNASVQGTINEYEPPQEKIKRSWYVGVLLILAALAGVFYLIKTWLM